MSHAATAKHSWRESLSVYRHPRVIGMLFLGFSAGLPLVLVFATLSAWLRDVGVSRTAIGFVSWVALTYSIKVLWSPIVDHVKIPVLHSALGRRRSWMILAICGVAAGLVGMATTDPAQDLWRMALFALIVAFCSATQDIAIDAYRIEAVDLELQGGMAGTYQAGYMLGVRIVGGAFALYIAEQFGWSTSYLIMAACMGVGFVTVLIIREPDTAERVAQPVVAAPARSRLIGLPGKALRWFVRAIIEPFVDFFARNGRLGLVILLFVGLFRLSDITLGVMANPFYIDMGFSLSDIATATKVLGLAVTIAGAGFGGLLVYRIGVMWALLISAVLLMLTNLLFAWMAWFGSSEFWVIAVAVSADNFAFGISGSAFIAYLSSLTSVSYTATQYALFTSLMLLPGKILAGFSGVIVDAEGYIVFFLYASSLGIPAILLVLYLMKYVSADAQAPARQATAQSR
ncbi:MAG: MFS transporter [Alphaproteobacteria bacterium]|nr:MFS transporter [Alphaproteobacteria bacterium]